jgi:segregation and condensation protein A
MDEETRDEATMSASALPAEAAAPPRTDGAVLLVRLEGFEGPLDLLLDLARRQRVDLARISILALVEQYLEVINQARALRLEIAAEWLVMAAWLAWLKSRLLLPKETEAAEEGELAAEALTERLILLEAMRQAAAWLGARPELGRDVFARGRPENFTEVDRSQLAADLPALLRAYAGVIRERPAPYRPPPPPLWTVRAALRKIETWLGAARGPLPLEAFLPPELEPGPARAGAVAATFLAGLELTREGRLRLEQEEPFGPILVAPGEGG